jgi:PBP1b-binding outer membrane lipoprotein LpoB
MTRSAWLILLIPLLVGGCAKPDKPSVYSADPSLKIPSLKYQDLRDTKALRQMVKDLDSDDPAVRFYTINKLKEITGNTLGYRYYDDEMRRLPALKKWQQWLAEREGTTKPATMGAATP